MSDLVDRLRDTIGACALLESSTSTGPLARRTLFARHPRAILVADARQTTIVTAAGARTRPGDALDHLRALHAELRPEGALFGALAYDYARPRQAHAAAPRLLALAVDHVTTMEEGRLASDDISVEPPLDAPLVF